MTTEKLPDVSERINVAHEKTARLFEVVEELNEWIDRPASARSLPEAA